MAALVLETVVLPIFFSAYLLCLTISTASSSLGPIWKARISPSFRSALVSKTSTFAVIGSSFGGLSLVALLVLSLLNMYIGTKVASNPIPMSLALFLGGGFGGLGGSGFCVENPLNSRLVALLKTARDNIKDIITLY